MQTEAARDKYRSALAELAASLKHGLCEEKATFERGPSSMDNDVHEHLAAAAFHLRPILGVRQTNLLMKAIKRYVSYAG
jgi:hypothetical protein